MTLEEAIIHAEKVYEEKLDERSYALEFHDNEEAEECQKCAEERRQLAEWLKELAERRKLPEEIIFCKDCKHYKIDHPKANGYHCCYRCHNIFPMKETDFCSRAERRTDGQRKSD